MNNIITSAMFTTLPTTIPSTTARMPLRIDMTGLPRLQFDGTGPPPGGQIRIYQPRRSIQCTTHHQNATYIRANASDGR